jgi:two-component sensor histidine kinase
LKRLPLIAITLIIGSTSWSQTRVDSLKNALTTANDDSVSVTLLNELASFNLDYSYRKCVDYAEQSLALSNQNSYHWGQARALQLLGTTQWTHSIYPKSRRNLQNAIEIYKSLGNDNPLAQCFNTLGLNHFYVTNYDLAIEYLDSALLIFQSLGDTTNISRVMNNLGLVYQKQGNFPLSTKFIIDGLRHKLRYSSIRDQQNSTLSNLNIHSNAHVVSSVMNEKRNLINQGIQRKDIYMEARGISELGALHHLVAQYDSAIFYLNKSVSIYDSIDEPSRFALDLIDIGNSHRELGNIQEAQRTYKRAWPVLIQERMFPTLGSLIIKLSSIDSQLDNYQSAIKRYHEGLEFTDSIQHLAGKSKILGLLSQVYIKIEQFDNALKYAQSSFDIAVEIGSFSQETDAVESLYKAHLAIGSFKKAVAYQNRFYEMRLKNNDQLNHRASLDFQARFELKEKAEQIFSLAAINELRGQQIQMQNRTLIYLAVAFIIGLILTLMLWNKNKRVRNLNKQITKRNSENELLLKEIHHRVKNNLQMITSLLNMQKRRISDSKSEIILNETKNRVLSIGMLHEHLYSNNNLSEVDIKVYTQHLIDMLNRSITSEDQVSFQFEIEHFSVKMDVALTIGLILNELITNALKYAFVDTHKPIILVKIEIVDDSIQLVVWDNGVGIGKINKGLGWTIIDNLTIGMNGKSQLCKENGTKVSITLDINTVSDE